jgi:TonB family protein
MSRWPLRKIGLFTVIPAGLLIGAADLGAEPSSAVVPVDEVPELSVTTGNFQPAKLDSYPPNDCVRDIDSRATERSPIATPECRAMDAVAHGAEGWVTLSMMVDSTGKPFEAAVTESTGNSLLEEAALSKAEESRYRPALENGKPIESAVAVKYVFALFGTTGARPEFIRAYKAFQNAATAQDRGAADLCLQSLKVRHCYL